jgi:hypothetical protein
LHQATVLLAQTVGAQTVGAHTIAKELSFGRVRPLAAKLGFQPELRSLVVGPTPAEVVDQLFEPSRRATSAPYDVILAFCPDRKALDRHARTLPARLTVAGALWLAWPKRSSGVDTDIREADVIERGLATGLVDNKNASIDEVWSGLRFVRRLADR